MRIELNKIDDLQFSRAKCVIGGEACQLITPRNISIDWSAHNLMFRSSVWNSDGELISAGYPKFFNWGERADLIPHPVNFNENTNVLEKIDGSTLIVSAYKGQLIARTRGTIDARQMPNGHEISILLNEHSDISPFILKNENMSLLFEWVSPANQIVIRHEKPAVFLTGCIKHENYRLFKQRELDTLAKTLKLKRPNYYKFDSFYQMKQTIEALRDSEGVCIYFDDDQNIRKLKSIFYLARHRFRSNVSLGNLMDMFFDYQCPDSAVFLDRIARDFDWECAEMAKELAGCICDAATRANKKLDEIRTSSESLAKFPRKQAAEIIQQRYQPPYSSAAFQYLNNKKLSEIIYRKIIHQELTK